jgi:hypothetical protein
VSVGVAPSADTAERRVPPGRPLFIYDGHYGRETSSGVFVNYLTNVDNQLGTEEGQIGTGERQRMNLNRLLWLAANGDM